MRRPERRRRAEQGSDSTVFGTALLGCIIAVSLASGVAVVATVRSWDIAPRVGDIAVFRPDAQFMADWQVTAGMSPDRTGALPGTATCVLRPDIMTANGGSLVVEARNTASSRYRVHWAGPHTSLGASDCGRAANLTLSRADLQMLINAVDGTRVEPGHYPDF
jgi:hypothetical protein